MRDQWTLLHSVTALNVTSQSLEGQCNSMDANVRRLNRNIYYNISTVY